MVNWGEFAGAGSDEIDEEQAGPSAAALPKGCETVLVGVFRRRRGGSRNRSRN